jgi:SAM-dependent methyltransferase
MKVPPQTFDACYYARSCGRPYRRDAEWLAFFGAIADRIVSDIRPRRVLDAGCAIGLLVETLRSRGVEASGIDVSTFAIDHVHGPVRPFCRQASATEPLSERYDLIISIEVLEHMTPAEAEAAIANFCAHTDDVLFSSSPFDFTEATHTNVRPPDYWASEFARHGFYRDVDFDASVVTPWAVRFRSRNDPLHRVVRDYERALSRIVIERNELRHKALATQAEISQMTPAREAADARAASGEAALGAQARELHEARAALMQAQADHAQLQVDHAQLQADHAQLQARLAQVDTDLLAAQTAEAQRQTALAEAQTALAGAKERVVQMEKSWFWRARTPWAWFSRKMRKVSVIIFVSMTAGWSCQRLPIPNPNNELPFGVVDGPQEGKVVGRAVEVSGWALDDTGVAEVRIYVDARYKMSAPLKIKRPDVTKVYPKYSVPEDMHGWWEVVDLGEAAGRHHILAQAIDESGATRDIGSVNVEVIAR